MDAMIAQITIPVGASIGEHEHVNETEYYIITEGEGTVRDNGTDYPVKAGEVVMTPNGSTHSIENTGIGDPENDRRNYPRLRASFILPRPSSRRVRGGCKIQTHKP